MPHITPLNPLLGHERDVDRGSATEDISNLVQRRVGIDQPSYPWNRQPYVEPSVSPGDVLRRGIPPENFAPTVFPNIRARPSPLSSIPAHQIFNVDAPAWLPSAVRGEPHLEGLINPWSYNPQPLPTMPPNMDTRGQIPQTGILPPSITYDATPPMGIPQGISDPYPHAGFEGLGLSDTTDRGLFNPQSMWQNIWDRDPYSRFFPGVRNEVEDYRQLYSDFTNWTPPTTRMRRGIENALDPYIEKYPWSSYLASQLLPTRSFTHINPFSR